MDSDFKTKSTKIMNVQGSDVRIMSVNDSDYISPTDMTANFDGGYILIDSWLRNKDTIEFLGLWEKLNNTDFNSVEFDRIRSEAGTNRFRLSVKQWQKNVNGIGIIAKTGRYGGTFLIKI
jgi:hypothetical protein